MKVNAAYIRGTAPIDVLHAKAPRKLAKGEIVNIGGTWGFAKAAVAKKGDPLALVIRSRLVEMDRPSTLNRARVGHILYVDTAAKPPVLKCSGGATTISREHIGIIHETPAKDATRVRVVWGGPL